LNAPFSQSNVGYRACRMNVSVGRVRRGRTMRLAAGSRAFRPAINVWRSGSPELEEVVGGADEFPFGVDRAESSSLESSDASGVFDLTEDRFDDLAAPFVEGAQGGVGEACLHGV